MACLMMVLMSVCFFSHALCENEAPGREVLYFFENYCESCNPEEDFKAYFRSLTGVSLDACDYRAYNTAKSSGQKALSEAAQKYGLEKTSVPMVIVDGIAYYGAGEMDEALVVDALSWGETTDSVIVLLTVPMCESCLRAAKTLKQLPDTVILKRGNHEIESVVVPQIIDITEQPALAAALMAAVLYAAVRVLPEGAIWTLILVAIGIVAYAVFAVLTGAVSKEDLAPILRLFSRRGKQKKGE